MKAGIVPVVLLTTLGSACGAVTPLVTVRLEPERQVRGGEVTVGDIAYLTTHDLDLIVRLLKLPLGSAVSSGQPVDRAALARRLAQAGVASDRIEWRGSELTRVSRGKSELSGEEIARTAQASLRSWLVERGGHWELQLQGAPQPVRSDEGALEMRVRPPTGIGARDRAVMWVDVFSGDRHLRAVPVNFDVSTWGGTSRQAQPALSAPLPATAPLAAPTRRLAPQMPTPVRESPSALPVAARLQVEDGSGPVAVTRGQWASLKASAGSIVLERRVEILQDARVGDQVRVRHPGAAGTLIARVMAPGQLEIQE